jgi:hypothetical protein
LKAGLPARLPAPQWQLDAEEWEMFRASGGTKKPAESGLAGKIAGPTFVGVLLMMNCYDA